MDDDRFVAYLHAHLLGAEAGLSTARRLARQQGFEETIGQMVSSIEDDHRVLRRAIDRLGGVDPPSPLTRIVGLGTSLLARGRQMLSPTPSVLEDLEALAVGVWGKRLLWGALARRAASDERLVKDAEAQELELLRLRDDVLDGRLDDDGAEGSPTP